MATNTNKRKCKECGVVFEKKRPLDYLCSPACIVKNNSKKAPKKTEIKKYSSNNKINQSSGTKLTSSTLAKLITRAKESKIAEMIDNYGYIFCEDCNEFGVPKDVNEMDLKIIDCSHEISVKKAKEMGRSELAYDVDNIRMRCRYHHKIHDKTI